MHVACQPANACTHLALCSFVGQQLRNVYEFNHNRAARTCSRFTIHGLWPENLDGTWPQFCNTTPFNVTALHDILPLLKASWPSVFSKSASFWQHEWRRHGTCAMGKFATERDFFASVLQLDAQYDANVRACCECCAALVRCRAVAALCLLVLHFSHLSACT